MCEPATATLAVTAIVGAASAGYQAYSANQAGKAAEEAGQRNSLLAQQAAASAIDVGETESGKVRSQARLLMSRQKVAMLAQGISGEGVNDILNGTASLSEADADTIRNNAARQAWGFRNQADTSLYEGKLAAARAKDQMVGSLLTGFGRAAAGAAGAYAMYSSRSGLDQITPMPNSTDAWSLKGAALPKTIKVGG